jgi:hypothetical protein
MACLLVVVSLHPSISWLTIAKKKKDSHDSSSGSDSNKDKDSSFSPDSGSPSSDSSGGAADNGGSNPLIGTPKTVMPDIPGPTSTQNQNQQLTDQGPPFVATEPLEESSGSGSSGSGDRSSHRSLSKHTKMDCNSEDLTAKEEKKCAGKDSDNINLDGLPSVDKFSIVENHTAFLIRWANDSYTGSVAVPKIASESSIGTNVHTGIVPAS